MSLVRVKTNGQVTIPTWLRERAGLNVGDLLEAQLDEGGRITLTPRTLLERHIEEGLEDIRKGRTYGPFDTADEMIASLQRNLKKCAKGKGSKRPAMKLDDTYYLIDTIAHAK
jgi:AbrB family looped-hinge helix DNA binding protein